MKEIAITMGEPGGIGPEIVLKAVDNLLKASPGSFVPILVGDPAVFAEASKLTGIKLDAQIVATKSAFGYKKNLPTATGGKVAAEAISRATGLVMSDDAKAMVTAPISKEAMKMARFEWPGHTEMLADITGTDDYAMMLIGGRLRVMLVTIHTALRDVPDLITKDAVLRKLRLAHQACRMMKMDTPRIAVAGLNPHAGENGMFGSEEKDHIIPAIEAAQAQGINATGPYPADTVFYRALQGDFDLIVSMYHDQGLAPLKAIAFDTGVNVTIGLPIVRTSPDHGTAYEIAWQNKASSKSMEQAIKAAIAFEPIK